MIREGVRTLRTVTHENIPVTKCIGEALASATFHLFLDCRIPYSLYSVAVQERTKASSLSQTCVTKELLIPQSSQRLVFLKPIWEILI